MSNRKYELGYSIFLKKIKKTGNVLIESQKGVINKFIKWLFVGWKSK